MASLDHRLNPLFSIKECSSCGALYTTDFCCSKGDLKDKILVPKPPQNCATCRDPIDGLYCRPCAFVGKFSNFGTRNYTIPEKDKFSVEDLIPIPSGSKGVSDDICDNDHSDAESLLSRDIPIMSSEESIFSLSESSPSKLAPIPPGMNEDEFDEEEDDCYNDDTLSDDDSGSFFEEADTSFSYLDNSLPEFETFSDHTEETRSGSTTTHANNSLPEYDSFLFEIEPDQGGLISIVISNNSNDPLLEPPEFESFHFDLYDDPLFPVPPPEPPDVEISLIVETDAPVINNFDELNEDDDSFTFIIRTFLPFLTYPEVSLLLSSIGNEDTIFDPGIST
ncbi:hypothetical protein Tco_0812159 [Tanacetum coccineum]